MASITSNQKTIVDRLWEWSNDSGDWCKLLVYKVVSTQRNLTKVERDEIFDYFLQSINFHSGLPPLEINKPTYSPSSKQIVLESLSDITGVNRLAKAQTLSFAKNITVIYGENGTGKTGYSRILKKIGFSYDTNNTILTNIYETAEPQSATINFTSNGVKDTFIWDGNNSHDELSNISVFNSNCVQFSIVDRNLIVSPLGFHLFNLLSEELDELSQRLKEKTSMYSTNLNWVESLKFGTPQFNFLKSLSEFSTQEKLIELSTYTNEEELAEKRIQLKNLNRTLLETEIQALTLQVQELQEKTHRIREAQKILNPGNWKKLIDYNINILEAEVKSQKGIKEIIKDKGVEFFYTDEFNDFLRAAEAYINIAEKTDYPEENDICVYCLQKLDSHSQNLLASYRRLLNDKSEEQLNILKGKKNTLIGLASSVDTNLTFSQPIFGVDESQVVVQPYEIIDYNTKLGAFRNIFINDKIDLQSNFLFDYDHYITTFDCKEKEVQKQLQERIDALLKFDVVESELQKEIDEIEDRILLNTKKNEVEAVIRNYGIVKILNSKASCFNTSTISRKTTLARSELVEQQFEDLFWKELRSLRKDYLKISLEFGTDKGNSKIYQKISGKALTDILSEGEQKAISLAGFLTELQIDDSRAPVIFDDPVNSLDHRIIDEVVKRLIELSKDRQVICFTHSILLLNGFKQQFELPRVKDTFSSAFYEVRQNFGSTGIIDDIEGVNSYTYYISKLKTIVGTNDMGQSEADLAAVGYGHLRSAIEITVEADIFKNTIKRYRKNVAFPSLLRVSGIKIDENKERLNSIYEKCCSSIDGHSSPEQVQSTPTLLDLRNDFTEFQKLRASFLP